jgi:hypothetical protein
MFAVGCIQSQSCHTNRCPTGVATQDPLRQRALVPEDKATRVFNFHRSTLHALSQMLAAAGLKHPSELRAEHLVRREGESQVQTYAESHTFLRTGELLDGRCRHPLYADAWRLASEESFAPRRNVASELLEDVFGAESTDISASRDTPAALSVAS